VIIFDVELSRFQGELSLFTELLEIERLVSAFWRGFRLGRSGKVHEEGVRLVLIPSSEGDMACDVITLPKNVFHSLFDLSVVAEGSVRAQVLDVKRLRVRAGGLLVKYPEMSRAHRLLLHHDIYESLLPANDEPLRASRANREALLVSYAYDEKMGRRV